MPVNPLAKSKNAADELLGQEDQDAQAKRGYSVGFAGVPQTTSTGKQFNYDDAYDTKTVPAYITAERDRINRALGARGTIPTAGALKATGLLPTDPSAFDVASGAPLSAASALASPYLDRATNGINSLFGGSSVAVAPNSGSRVSALGGATGLQTLDIGSLTVPEQTRYAELARTTGQIPTAEAAQKYESEGELGRQRFQEFLKDSGLSQETRKNYRHQSPVY